MQNASIEIQNILTKRFEDSKLKNPRFSLRSFAKQLKLPVSTLSDVMNGKRGVSRKLATQVLSKLHIDLAQSEKILNNLEDPRGKTSRPKPIRYSELDIDSHKTIADWYHFAILSLTETEDYTHDAKWIATRLGITQKQAKEAIERLERLQMLVPTADGKVKSASNHYSTSDHLVNLSLRRAHAQNLELAKTSLENDSIEMRDFTAITMAIDPNKMNLAKKMIRAFRDELARALETDSKTEVYKLCMQFFPLTKIEGNNNEN